MVQPSFYVFFSLLSVLVIAKDEDFEIPGPDKLEVSPDEAFYFRFDSVPLICNDSSAVLCVVVKNTEAKIVNAGHPSLTKYTLREICTCQ